VSPLWIWAAAILLYAAFSVWYVGVRGPLSKQEVESHLARLAGTGLAVDAERLARLRAFLDADDGREFFMLNLIRLRPGPVLAPGASQPAPAREVLEGYTGPFMRALFRRAGHPAFFGRAAGGYLEEWNVAPDPGWTVGAAIRYRSRRDMIELVNDPRFAGDHAFKEAALESTFAFPTAPAFVTVGPRIWVALALALAAALAHLVLRRGA
jgi:hypothetical protein